MKQEANTLGYKKEELKKQDAIIILLMAVFSWLLAASSLGFLSAGFNCPYVYVGSDDFSILSQAKELNALLNEITGIFGYEPIWSEKGGLYFYNLYPYIDSNPELLSNNALTLQDIECPPYSNGTVIVFGIEGYNASKYVKSGLSGVEEGFTWIDGESMTMTFNFEEAIGKTFMGEIDCVNVFNGSQYIQIVNNGQIVFEGLIDSVGTITFDGFTNEDGIVELIVNTPDCISPKSLGMGEDLRDLSLTIKSMKFTVK